MMIHSPGKKSNVFRITEKHSCHSIECCGKEEHRIEPGQHGQKGGDKDAYHTGKPVDGPGPWQGRCLTLFDPCKTAGKGHAHEKTEWKKQQKDQENFKTRSPVHGPGKNEVGAKNIG